MGVLLAGSEDPLYPPAMTNAACLRASLALSNMPVENWHVWTPVEHPDFQ
jgi:hypothetical protein